VPCARTTALCIISGAKRLQGQAGAGGGKEEETKKEEKAVEVDKQNLISRGQEEKENRIPGPTGFREELQGCALDLAFCLLDGFRSFFPDKISERNI